MTEYREILRLHSMGFSQRNIAYSCHASKTTVSRVLKKAKELGIVWPLDENQTNGVLAKLFSTPSGKPEDASPKPDFAYIRKELMRSGVTKKLLWVEYMEECKMNNQTPLMYSQFCHHIQKEEQKHRASMHISRKPGEQIEVDWAGDPAHIIDPDTGEITDVSIFVATMSYSQYAYAEGFLNEKQQAWITAHIHMYNYFGGVAKILVPDNLRTAVDHNKDWYTPKLNRSYHEMAEHYGAAILPARVRRPKDKPNAEGAVGHISTWIVGALRNEQFFSLTELNSAIIKKLNALNRKEFQKKEGSRLSLFRNEEMPFLLPLPTSPYELAVWKQATVQFNYHISVEGMLYSVPFEYIKKKVDVRITETIIEAFYNQNRIASHRRLHGRRGQYSTIPEHMPPDHQRYVEWDGNRFRKWAEKIGPHTLIVINSMLSYYKVEQQGYRSCMGLLQLSKKYGERRVEAACEKAMGFTGSPSFKIIKNILVTSNDKSLPPDPPEMKKNVYGMTRGAKYYGGNGNDK
ncbi:IS21 family transposase [Proteiniclasticum sp.]|uniref:IS21 family transposase n=1 Tax=Proteiniclasticum sp. TaxID=2053595 RepID=UPI002897FF96|nr:IS21 family transposase [Proteiniclasticum sp.]